MKLHSRPTSTVAEQPTPLFSSSPASPSPNPSSAKPRPSRKPKLDKENAPPSDPNTMPSPAVTNTKLKNSPLPPKPPRPPSSNPLKRKLALEDASVPPSSDSGVKVVVRMRPPQKETDEGDVIVQKISGDSLSINGQSFTFDAVADTGATQVDIFQLVGVPLVENCLAGFNSSVFAYGQTGSGKTYTMWGPANALLEGYLASDQQGLTPRVLERLFARIDEEQIKHADKQLKYQCHCSFLEIYNEHITDLLDPNQRSLQIREDVKTGVYVENLTEEFVSTTKDVTQLLVKGLSNRRTGATSINAESSRSHTVFTCVVESRCKSVADGISSFKTSRINLVDLAGSERQKLTGAAGERLKEAGNINRSLSQLGNLINILAEVSQTGKQRHIPYRDSRLTFLLQESLGGNAKLAMVCAISPAQSCKSETFSTLRFAQRAKAIKNKAVVNEVMQEDVNHLREVIRQLRDELHRIKANGNNPVESNGCHSAARIRRSLSLLKSGLNLPLTLTNTDEDGDTEMEIVEEYCVRPPPTNETKHLLASEDVHSPEVCDSSTSETKCCKENKSEDLDATMEGGISERDGFMTVNCLEPIKNITANNDSASPDKSERDPLVMPVTEKDDNEGSNLCAEAVHLSFTKPLTRSSPNTLTAQSSPNFQARYHHLAESIHRGIASINTHRRSMALRRSSVRFSLRPQESKLVFPKINVDVGVQTFFHDYEKEGEEDSAPFICIYCKNKTEVELKDITADSNLQLVPIDALDFVDNSKRQLPKAVEKVLAGSIRREMALEEFCAKQNSEIIQLNRLVQQYKHERECNAIISQMREDKIVRLESFMDGVLTNEEFWEEELLSLAQEHKILQEKYRNHPELLRTKIELKKLQEDLEQCRNFYELGEREVLLEEIQDLRTQLQFYIDLPTTSKRQTPLLQLTNSSNQNLVPSLSTIPESAVESADVKLEQERIRWADTESRWISLSEELRSELAASRSLAEKRLRELEIERKCCHELNDAMQMAMEGHARILEQYADLEEKHIQLLARHRRIQEGIEDVKKAASKAGVRGAESKFINALAAEISALKLEREKERRYLRDENKGLQAQLNDTAEAVQAAGELLVRLKEAEEAVAAAEKRAADAEKEAGKAYKQIEILKSTHEKEVCTLNELLLEARLSTETKQPPYDGGFITADSDVGLRDSNKDEKWKEGFEPFYNGQDGEWFSGYDRCNI